MPSTRIVLLLLVTLGASLCLWISSVDSPKRSSPAPSQRHQSDTFPPLEGTPEQAVSTRSSALDAGQSERQAHPDGTQSLNLGSESNSESDPLIRPYGYYVDKYAGYSVDQLEEARDSWKGKYIELQTSGFRREWKAGNFTTEFLASGEPRLPVMQGEIAQLKIDDSYIPIDGVHRIKVVTLPREEYPDAHLASDEFSWLYKEVRRIKGDEK